MDPQFWQLREQVQMLESRFHWISYAATFSFIMAMALIPLFIVGIGSWRRMNDRLQRLEVKLDELQQRLTRQ
jgi:hypothetical protein